MVENHTVTHSIKLINDILYIMRVGLPCGPRWGGVHGETAVSPRLQGPFEGNDAGVVSGCVKVVLFRFGLSETRFPRINHDCSVLHRSKYSE